MLWGKETRVFPKSLEAFYVPVLAWSLGMFQMHRCWQLGSSLVCSRLPGCRCPWVIPWPGEGAGLFMELHLASVGMFYVSEWF